MKTILTSLLILATSLVAQARVIRQWSDQELFDKSDLVVIAIPISSSDTPERADLPGFPAQHVIGVETGFAASVVVKGDKTLKKFVLHHYRADKNTVPNGPSFISFKPEEKRSFRLFLIKEADGRYAPTAGQVDPGSQRIAVLCHPDNSIPDSKPQALEIIDLSVGTVELPQGFKHTNDMGEDSTPGHFTSPDGAFVIRYDIGKLAGVYATSESNKPVVSSTELKAGDLTGVMIVYGEVARKVVVSFPKGGPANFFAEVRNKEDIEVVRKLAVSFRPKP